VGLEVHLLKAKATTYKTPKNMLCKGILNAVIHFSKLQGN